MTILKRAAKAALALTPYSLQRRRNDSGVPDSDQFSAAASAVELVRGHSMVATEALVTLYRQVAHCEAHGVDGALVECGVWKGGAAGLMALANLHQSARRRRLHLFDSFVGIPEPDARLDGTKAVSEVGGLDNARGRLKVANDYHDRGGPGSAEGCVSFLESLGYDRDWVTAHVGWFQDTVPQDSALMGPIALLHLDGDWYESTRICLEHLYPLVSIGGFVMIDDYGCYEGCRRAVDEFLGRLDPVPFLHFVNRDVRYIEKPASTKPNRFELFPPDATSVS